MNKDKVTISMSLQEFEEVAKKQGDEAFEKGYSKAIQMVVEGLSQELNGQQQSWAKANNEDFNKKFDEIIAVIRTNKKQG